MKQSLSKKRNCACNSWRERRETGQLHIKYEVTRSPEAPEQPPGSQGRSFGGQSNVSSRCWQVNSSTQFAYALQKKTQQQPCGPLGVKESWYFTGELTRCEMQPSSFVMLPPTNRIIIRLQENIRRPDQIKKKKKKVEAITVSNQISCSAVTAEGD